MPPALAGVVCPGEVLIPQTEVLYPARGGFSTPLRQQMDTSCDHNACALLYWSLYAQTGRSVRQSAHEQRTHAFEGQRARVPAPSGFDWLGEVPAQQAVPRQYLPLLPFP